MNPENPPINTLDQKSTQPQAAALEAETSLIDLKNQEDEVQTQILKAWENIGALVKKLAVQNPPDIELLMRVSQIKVNAAQRAQTQAQALWDDLGQALGDDIQTALNHLPLYHSLSGQPAHEPVELSNYDPATYLLLMPRILTIGHDFLAASKHLQADLQHHLHQSS